MAEYRRDGGGNISTTIPFRLHQCFSPVIVTGSRPPTRRGSSRTTCARVTPVHPDVAGADRAEASRCRCRRCRWWWTRRWSRSSRRSTPGSGTPSRRPTPSAAPPGPRFSPIRDRPGYTGCRSSRSPSGWSGRRRRPRSPGRRAGCSDAVTGPPARQVGDRRRRGGRGTTRPAGRSAGSARRSATCLMPPSGDCTMASAHHWSPAAHASSPG